MSKFVTTYQEEAAHIEQAQEYATQQAFLLLFSRQLNEYQHLAEVLRKTIEHSIETVQASGGEIWLLSPQGRLELSYSTLPIFDELIKQRAWRKILAEWAVQQRKSFRTTETHLAELAAETGEELPPNVISIPLFHREKIIGAMILLSIKNKTFDEKDEERAQSIADLATPVIEKAMKKQALQKYAEQQQLLFKMSLQITQSLDLEITLDRSLQWIDRIINTEFGLLWLVDDSENTLSCTTALGVPADMIEKMPVYPIPSDTFISKILSDQKVIIQEHWEDTAFHTRMSTVLQTPIHNMVAIPILGNEEPIGVIFLFNFIGEELIESDLTMLSIATQMVSIAISNAKFYKRAQTLNTEREQYYKIAIQRERLAAIGRLMSSLSHEINNPLQAVRGALALAIEDIEDPAELKVYFDIMQRETIRVVQLLKRMRQIYRPASEGMEPLNINRILLETFALTAKELSRHNTLIENQLSIQVPPIIGEASQIHLAFLNILLSLGDAIGAADGGVVTVSTHASQESIEIIFSTPTHIPQWEQIFNTAASYIQTGTGFSLLLSREIIIAHEGKLTLEQDDTHTRLTLNLPLHKTQELPVNIEEQI